MTAGSADRLRVGCVKYLNARPLIFGWDGAVEFDHPAALCRKLAQGQLDVAFVSSFEYLQNPIYTIVDDVAVGSDGAVESVFLAHDGAFSEIREVVLDPASRTSVNLLRCLLAEANVQAQILDLSGEQATITASRAQLFIGDQALRFRAQHGSTYTYRDLGDWWKAVTGLPFVFALWLIRPDVKDAQTIAGRLRALRDANLGSLPRLIAAETEFSAPFCHDYFTKRLRFGLGEREKQGLIRFRELCAQHGILSPRAAPLRFA